MLKENYSTVCIFWSISKYDIVILTHRYCFVVVIFFIFSLLKWCHCVVISSFQLLHNSYMFQSTRLLMSDVCSPLDFAVSFALAAGTDALVKPVAIETSGLGNILTIIILFF